MNKKHPVTFIPGDGVGPEISSIARECIDATGAGIAWEDKEAGADVMDRNGGNPLPSDVLDSIRKSGVALKGPITTPVGTGFRSVNVALRKKLDLYACLRPCKSYPGIKSPYRDIDLIVVRENTEDLYAGIEFEAGKEVTGELISFVQEKVHSRINADSGISLKPISRSASERIVHFAFRYAKKNNRRKVTAVHKANIMKYSDGLFLNTFREVSTLYPEIEAEDRIVDNMCMQLVQKPHLYDVLVLPNLYGDIISDLCAGLVGGLGLAPGANIGDDIAVFEATHGSAPKYKGMNKVNPCAMVLSGVLMLKHIGEDRAAHILEEATARVISQNRVVTYDLGGTARNTEVGREIIKQIRHLSKP